MKHRLSGMAGVLAGFIIAGGFLVVRAEAQTPNAVVVKNVDEKGRNPYMENQNLVCNKGPLCELAFPAVAAGKRLVIQHVNAGIGIPTGPRPFYVIGRTGHYSVSAARATSLRRYASDRERTGAGLLRERTDTSFSCQSDFDSGGCVHQFDDHRVPDRPREVTGGAAGRGQ